MIKILKESVSIPVIGNGDVKTAQDVLDMMKQTECDGVMVGRAALSNPWFFNKGLHFLVSKVNPPLPRQ